MTENRPWLNVYPDEIPASIAYDQKPLYSFLEESALVYKEKKALHFMGNELSFTEVYEQSKKMAHYLQTIGTKKGDRIAIMLPNCPQSVIGYYGALMAGAIVVQVNPLYKERELQYQLDDAGATVLVCLDIFLPTVSAVQSRTSVKDVIVTQIKDYLPFPKNVIYPIVQKKQTKMLIHPEANENTHIWEQMMKYSSPEYKEIEVDPKTDLALLQYTGGTTGYPKGVMLTHYNLVANVEMIQAWLYKSNPGEEVVLGILPFFHVYGMTAVMNLSIMFGSKMILLPKFNAKEVLKTIDKLKPTLLPGAPTIYVGLLSHPDMHKYDLSSIKACISGSAPLPANIQAEFEKVTNGRLVEGYGLSETSPITHANFVWDDRVQGSIGVPWPDTDAKIIDMETLDEAAIGEIGELAVKGPQVMEGYWNRPEETENVLTEDGWLRTGDLGYMDERGYFYIVDRKKDIIIAGGFNIYPREVEEVLYEHQAILEVAVAGVPDPYRGETVKAYVVLKEGQKCSEEDLNAYCREKLAAFKVPRIYEFRDELPKTTIGKILRRQLVAEEKAKNNQIAK